MGKEEINLTIEWTGQYVSCVRVTSGGTQDRMELLGVYDTQTHSDDDVAAFLGSVCKSGIYDAIIGFISRRAVIMRTFELPSLKTEELRTMLALQLEHHIPYSVDEVYYDFVHTPSMKEGYSHVVVSVCTKKDIARLLSWCGACGLTLKTITVSTWGLVAVQRKNVPVPGDVVIIDSDEDETECVVVRGGVVMYSRGITYEVRIPEAEMVKRLEVELRHTMESLEKEGIVIKNPVLVLSRTAMAYAALIKQFIPLSGNAVSLGDVPFYCADQTLQMRGDRKSYAACLGAGSMGESMVPHLLPESMRSEQRKALYAQDQKKALLLFALCCVLLVLSVGILFTKKILAVRAIESRVMALDPEAKKLSHVIRTLRIVDEVRQSQVTPLLMITELYRVLPQTTTLTAMEYDSTDGVTIRGTVSTMSQVSDIIMVLHGSDYFKSAEIKYAKQKSGQGIEIVDFDIYCPYMSVRE